ncbi:AI-2E family transporter [Persicirhabdus sediminis]|uniref:AI-2E family transporter n=1 Tax=Persicirhabdus sediminis TaxID=454144 RepID=A0A8J7SHY6_9BACT|nr:AI-2E family transporter [Persicirhabdus sediminis]MBK1790091.1 AI-2E family transporter [Persicirhabdus sediminis]
MSDYPNEFQRKTLWSALTGIAIVIIGLLVIGLIWLTSSIFSYLQAVLLPLAVAGIIAYLLDPIVSSLQKKGLSRLKSVLAVFCSFFIVIMAISAWIVVPLLNDDLEDTSVSAEVIAAEKDAKRDKLIDGINAKMEKLSKTPAIRPVIAYLNEPVDSEGELVLAEDTKTKVVSKPRWHFYLINYSTTIASTATSWLSSGTTKFLGLMGLAIGFAMLPIYLFYFLIESAAIKQHWKEYIPLKSSKFKDELTGTLQEINGYLISFFRGQVLVAFIDGLLVGIALSIFGLPYGFVIGLFLTVLGIIPYIGNILCLVPACIIAFVHFSQTGNQGFLGENPWFYVLAVIGIFFIVQQINSLVTAPKIVGDSVGLHPMTVIFSMLFWSIILGGFVGALLAVPLTAALKVLFRRYVWEASLSDATEKKIAKLTNSETPS